MKRRGRVIMVDVVLDLQYGVCRLDQENSSTCAHLVNTEEVNLKKNLK